MNRNLKNLCIVLSMTIVMIGTWVIPGVLKPMEDWEVFVSLFVTAFLMIWSAMKMEKVM
jgi:hypothetical protein